MRIIDKWPRAGWGIAAVIAVVLVFTAAAYGSETSQLNEDLARVNADIGRLRTEMSALELDLDDEKVAREAAEGETAEATAASEAAARKSEELRRKLKARRSLPSFIGDMVKDVRATASKYGWKLAETKLVSSEPPGTVLSQSPAAGMLMKLGAKVTITVAKKAPVVDVGGGGRCHPSYVGACLDPDALDYDCLGGTGNGPLYTGFVYVVGWDEFDLDGNDNDGRGCE